MLMPHSDCLRVNFLDKFGERVRERQVEGGINLYKNGAILTRELIRGNKIAVSLK